MKQEIENLYLILIDLKIHKEASLFHHDYDNFDIYVQESEYTLP